MAPAAFGLFTEFLDCFKGYNALFWSNLQIHSGAHFPFSCQFSAFAAFLSQLGKSFLNH